VAPFPDLAIRRATPADAGAVHALLAAAGRALAAQGFRNWEAPYPLDHLLRATADGALHVAHADDALVGTYMLRAAPVVAYLPSPWVDDAAPARYLNRMAVAPAWQGRGIGGRLLAHVEEQARGAGARVVRCDVLAANRRLRDFYERAGYRACGKRTHSRWDFVCMEREVGWASRVGSAPGRCEE
jgi:GNAT superfamily N-acetyltransferase